MRLTGEITVSPVENDTALWEFLRLPWHIYQGDPYWVPPILSHQRQFLDPRRGPFFEIGEARYFLASRDGRVVGRLSAHINRLHDTCHGPETGFFGFFESIPDPDVAAALFEAAAAWLAENADLASLPAEAEADHWAIPSLLSRLDAVLQQAVESLELAVVAKHAYILAQAFNSFYHRYPVAQEEDPQVRRVRAAVTRLYHDGMTQLLDLMGIEVPDRM